MISTTVNIKVSGESYQDIVEKSKVILSDFFETSFEELKSKINIEILITDVGQAESVNFDEQNFSAQIIAKVKNV